MRTRVIVVRGGLVLILFSLAAFGLSEFREGRRWAAAAAYYDRAYEHIEIGMTHLQVEQLLRSAGEVTAPPGWPRTLGEVPSYADGIPMEFSASGSKVSMFVGNGPAPPASNPQRFRYVVSPETPLWWRVWRVTGRHRWIAVAFLNDGSGGSFTVPTVIMKRSGVECLP